MSEREAFPAFAPSDLIAICLALTGAIFDTSRGASGFIAPWVGHLTAGLAGLFALARAARWNFRSIGISPVAHPSWKHWTKVGFFGLAVVGALVIAEFALQGRLGSPPEIEDGARVVELLVVAPVLEETVYRLCICGVMTRHFGVLAGVLSSSCLFVVVHLVRGNLDVSNALAGFFLGWVFIRSRTVLVPILFHAGGNLAALLLNMVIGARLGYPVASVLFHWRYHP